MTMTKAEQAEMNRMKQELAEVKALRWSGIQESERMEIPKDGFVNGWDFHTYRDDGRVERAWSKSYAHGVGSHIEEGRQSGTGSQNGWRLYRTELDAWIGLRLAKEQECAKILARIDMKIAAQRKEQT